MRYRSTHSDALIARADVLPSSLRLKKPSASCKTIYEQLDDYQKRAVEFAIERTTTGLFFEQGTGKTWIAAGVWERLNRGSALFIVPLTNIETTWQILLAKHFQVCRSLDEYKSWIKAWDTPCILLLHYEAINAKLLKKLRKIQWTLIVYDEAQRLKNRTSKTSRIAALLSACGHYRVALTGTPIDHRLTDLFGQFKFIKPDLLGKWKQFEERWLEPVDGDLSKYKKGSLRWKRAMLKLMISKNKRNFIEGKIPEFLELISQYALRVEKSDVLDLPSLDVVPHYVTLRGPQRQAYEQLDRTMILPDIELTTTHAATKEAKLHEICGGWVRNDNDEVIAVGRAKYDRMLYLMKRLHGPIVIFFKYVAELEAVEREFSKKYRLGVIRGKNKKTRTETIQQFQDGFIDVLLCQVKAGGVGVDLYQAHNAIIYSVGHSFIDFDQMLARLHRRGQLENVEFHAIIVQDTVDHKAYRSVLSKSAKTAGYLKHLKEKPSERREKEDDVWRGRPSEGVGHRACIRSRRAAQQ